MSPEPIPHGEGERREELTRLLQLVELAGQHQRAARARQLGARQVELGGLEHLVARGPLAPGELAHCLGLSSGGVTGLAARLVDAGLVDRARHPHDRRMRVLTPTQAGVAYVNEYLRPVLDPAVRAVRWLSPGEADQVGRALDALLVLKEQAAAATPGPAAPGEIDERTSALLM